MSRQPPPTPTSSRDEGRRQRRPDRHAPSSPLSGSISVSASSNTSSPRVDFPASRPRADQPIYSPIPVHLALTTQSLSQLSLAEQQSRPSSSSASSSVVRLSSPAEARLKAGSRRVLSTAPSSTSVSDDEGDDTPNHAGRNDGDTEPSSPITVDVQQARSWLDMGEDRRDKGKGKMVEHEGMAAKLPPEILLHIFRLLPDTRDLLSALLVNRTWCLYTFSLLWYKPHLPNIKTLASLIRVISNPKASLPYAQAVRRLHLSQLHPTITDDLMLGLSACTRVERLTLTGATHLSPEAIMAAVRDMPQLQAADFSGVMAVDDCVVEELAKTCAKLQAVNLSECKLVGDKGVLALAKHSKLLRRAKFQQCHRITDRSLIPLVQSCKLLLELDLQDVLTLTNAVVHSIFLHLNYLRDLRLNGCIQLTEDCIPHLPELSCLPDDQVVQQAKSVGLNSDNLNLLRPASDISDNLRSVDFTGCVNLGDKAIEHLIVNAPKLRSLTLTKCSLLTDISLESIERLGKHLHYLHVGHVRLITDQGVTSLAKSCTRLRYVDLACCELLTDESITEIGANMPKLRRVGLVKVVNLTDEAIYSLVERYSALERVHLSYCDNLTIKAITFMLNRLAHLKHLSLTGVSAFKKPELQKFCRAPPSNFNEHQRAAFCVFSGHKVDELRRYLNESYLCSGPESDDTSTRRGSSSSTSSITVPGGGSPPPSTQVQGQTSSTSTYVFRRGSAPVLRDRDQHYNNGIGLAAPGLPSTAFAAPTPNFLSPTMEFPSRSAGRNGSRNSSVDFGLGLGAGADVRSGLSNGTGNGTGTGVGLGIGVPSCLRESQTQSTSSSGMNSHLGSTSSGSHDDRWKRFKALQRDQIWERDLERAREERERPNGPRAPSGSVSVPGSGAGAAPRYAPGQDPRRFSGIPRVRMQGEVLDGYGDVDGDMDMDMGNRGVQSDSNGSGMPGSFDWNSNLNSNLTSNAHTTSPNARRDANNPSNRYLNTNNDSSLESHYRRLHHQQQQQQQQQQGQQDGTSPTATSHSTSTANSGSSGSSGRTVVPGSDARGAAGEGSHGGGGGGGGGRGLSWVADLIRWGGEEGEGEYVGYGQ
ncbi:hypothetical protein IAT40_001103 [Kwoniella sp. CBS 6097]